MPQRILNVVTNVALYDDPEHPTGLWLSDQSGSRLGDSSGHDIPCRRYPGVPSRARGAGAKVACRAPWGGVGGQRLRAGGSPRRRRAPRRSRRRAPPCPGRLRKPSRRAARRPSSRNLCRRARESATAGDAAGHDGPAHRVRRPQRGSSAADREREPLLAYPWPAGARVFARLTCIDGWSWIIPVGGDPATPGWHGRRRPPRPGHR